jgi:hypothetical protein
MTFARWVYLTAGVYGILLLTPMYFTEEHVSRDFPPAITHPEHYYGFIGVKLAWQVLFLMLSRDPVRYRPLMIPTILEKLSYVIALLVLYAQGRVDGMIFGFGMIDAVFAAFFVAAYLKTGKEATAQTSA